MPIPDYQGVMLPLLELAADQKVHSLRQAYDLLADRFALTAQERQELLPSGRQTTFHNRVGWARTYLKKAGLLSSPKRGYFQITSRGLEALKQNPVIIDRNFLMQYAEFQAFWSKSTQTEQVSNPNQPEVVVDTPEEIIETAYQQLREELANEVLETILSCSPAFFEQLVIDLLVKMGYGGTRRDAGKAIGQTNDEGIDGIIKEDRLGLDVVYIQAKRWDPSNIVSRPEIQKFAGALQGQRAKKGIFITTSSFSKSAYDFVARIESKIVLIDGDTLAQLMIDFNIGVTMAVTYELKRLDSDYFAEG